MSHHMSSNRAYNYSMYNGGEMHGPSSSCNCRGCRGHECSPQTQYFLDTPDYDTYTEDVNHYALITRVDGQPIYTPVLERACNCDCLRATPDTSHSTRPYSEHDAWAGVRGHGVGRDWDSCRRSTGMQDRWRRHSQHEHSQHEQSRPQHSQHEHNQPHHSHYKSGLQQLPQCRCGH